MAEKTKRNQRGNTDKNMSVWEHIKELRICLVVIVVTYLAAACGCYYFAPQFITYAMSLAEGYTFVQTGVQNYWRSILRYRLLLPSWWTLLLLFGRLLNLWAPV